MKISIIAVLLVGFVLLSGCAQNPPADQPGTNQSPQPSAQPQVQTITLGSILPLTGDAAEIGQTTKDAIQLAVDEVNEEWKSENKQIKVLFEDGKCSAEPAATAANKLVNLDKVPAIFGGLCSGETLAIAPIAEGKTVVLSNCSSAPKVREAGDYVFRDYPSDAFQGKVAAEFADSEGYENVAILLCLSDWCTGIADVFKENFTALGGKIAGEESYEQTSTDLRTQLTKIKATNPDLIYFLGYTNGTVAGLQQAKELGIEAQFLGGDAWDDPKIPEQAADAAEGIIYVTPKTPALPEFEAKLKEKFGRNQVTVCAPQGYDSVKIIAGIIKNVGTDSSKIKDELYKVQGYRGISGEISFDEKGDLVKGDYQVKTVEDGKLVNYEPVVEGEIEE